MFLTTKYHKKGYFCSLISHRYSFFFIGVRRIIRQAHPLNAKRLKVLFVNIDPILSNVLTVRLRKYRFQTLIARTETEALHYARLREIDAIIISPNMTHYQFTTFIQILREDLYFKQPLLILSDATEAEMPQVIEAIEAGADDFILMPFSPYELILRLQLLLHRVYI